jgi:hypothetical protein
LKKVALLALILVLALVASLSTTATNALGEADRHTPGFPQSAEGFRPPTSPPVNLSDVENAILELLKSGALSRGDAEKLKDFSSLSFQEAVERIDNSELRDNLLNLAGKEALSPEDIEAFLNYLNSLKTSGTLSPVDELLALRALEALTSTIQNPYTSEIMLRMLSALKGLEVAKSSPLPALKSPQQFSAEIPAPGLPSLHLPFVALPAIPQLRFSLPSIPLTTLIIIAICSSIALAALLGRKYARPIFKRLKIHRIGRAPVMHIGDSVLEAYWRSVHIVSTISGIQKADSETHREFLAKVCERLDPGVAEVFKDITLAYEVYRYGFRAEAGQRILSGFRRLLERAMVSA